jgi:hypothetical protein
MSTQPKTRKVAVSITLTVDPEAWANTYGEFSPADVRAYFLNMAQNCAAANEGCIVEATVKGA